VTDIRFTFETLQHDAKTFGFATEGPSLGKSSRRSAILTCWWHTGDAFGPRSTRRFAPPRATLRVSRPSG